MKPLLSFLLLCLSTSAFAQGAAPFWEPLAGPPGPLYAVGPMDSTIVEIVGGTIYIYDTSTNSWTPADNAENKFILPPDKLSGYDYDFATNHNNVWVTPYGGWRSYEDSLFFSTDSTFQWHFIGTFGTHPAKFNRAVPSIISLLETPSLHVVLVDDSGRMYITMDTFATIDTEQIPEPISSLFNDDDTLYVESVHGNFYRSIDFGKNWRMLLNLHDTASNWNVGIARKGDTWLLYDYQLQLSPLLYSNVNLWYSLDRGNDWTQMVNPAPASTSVPTFDGIDDAGRIYLTFHFAYDSSFRSDDLGKTWHKLPMPYNYAYSFYVQSDGTLYTGSFRSTDHGETWDTISSDGIVCIPFDMLPFQNSTVLSVSDGLSDGIYSSRDNGQTWPRIAWEGSARLSLLPNSSEWIMVNTTEKLYPNGANSICEENFQVYGSVGVITTNFHIWLGSNLNSPLRFVSESLDSSCSYVSFRYDTLSATPMVQIMEWAHDTILALSTSGVYRGYDVLIPFDTVTPEPGTHATPTGAMMKDSTGAIYVAMSDGKLFVTKDGANSWQSFPSPSTDSLAPVEHLAASPNGLLFAIDSNRATGYTTTWEYAPATLSWKNVTSGLRRQGFPDTADVTNIWYVNGYAYAGTWNMGLFRSLNPVGPVDNVAEAEHHSPFRLYPNPTAGAVTLTYPSSIRGTYRLADMAGREWERGMLPADAGTVTLDLRNLPDGLYELAGSGGWTPAKLVVKH